MMRYGSSVQSVAAELLFKKDLELVSCKILQSLWAGYGHICHVTARSNKSSKDVAETVSLILKYIEPPPQTKAMRDEGHIRKLLSYHIEQYFYTRLVPLMPPEIGIAACVSTREPQARDDTTAMLLQDLRQKYPVAGEKRGDLNETQTYAALRWLARFHGFWWTRTNTLYQGELCHPPLEHLDSKNAPLLSANGIWLNGGYTYLATRRSEYSRLAVDTDSEWSQLLCTAANRGASIAELVAALISPPVTRVPETTVSRYTTLIHGDVKSENLFTTRDGEQVAFFDFQYVGLGLGVCDLAKLFTCSVPLHMLINGDMTDDKIKMGDGEIALLRFYHVEVQKAAGKDYEWDVLVRHWETALVDWLRFQASWGFWGNTEWLEGRVRHILADRGWNDWLQSNL